MLHGPSPWWLLVRELLSLHLPTRLQREDRVVRGEKYRVAVAPRHVFHLRIGLSLVGLKGKRKRAQAGLDPAARFSAQDCVLLAQPAGPRCCRDARANCAEP